MARHTKLTHDLKDAIVAAIREGASLPAAAQAHDVEPTTAGYWLRLGQGPHARRPSMALYAAFAAEVLDALASAASRPAPERPAAAPPGDALTAFLAGGPWTAEVTAQLAAQQAAEMDALLAPFADLAAERERLRAGFEHIAAETERLLKEFSIPLAPRHEPPRPGP
jgi:transposase-like protein